MDELNPNHPVTRDMHNQWHKVVALLMLEAELTELEITVDMLNRFEREYLGGAVVADARGGGLVIRLVTAEEGTRLVRSEGGLPA